MHDAYLRILQTPSVESAQRAAYGRTARRPGPGSADQPVVLGPDERAFIGERDSFYLATVSSSGWPYVQHRGGPKGFLKVIAPNLLAFGDLEGNRQLLSVGNIAEEERVSLFLMDYVARERLKIIGRARLVAPEAAPEIAAAVAAGGGPRPTRLFLIEVAGCNWNCPKYITQRFTKDEVETVVRPLRERIEELEAALAQARRGVPGER